MLGVVRQTTGWSCFAASVAMVTGLDYELFDLSEDAAPLSFPAISGMSMDPDESYLSGIEGATIHEWTDLLDSLGYAMTLHREPVEGEEGILTFTVIEGIGKYWSHAVAIDKSGYATCPSSTFDEMHLTDFQKQCNVLISGFMTIREK